MQDEIIESKILEIIQNNSGKGIMFWGASRFLESFLIKQNQKFKNVIGIIDNNSKLWGEALCEYPIYSADKLKTVKDVLIIFTIKNDAKRFYDSVVRQINRTNNHTITISTNLFIQNKAELSDLNSIYIVKNNKKEKVDYIDGLDIIFEGINNIIEIGGDPLPKFTNCVIKMKNNNHVKIDSSEYNINRLNLRIEGDNASLTIGKDFSIQSGMIFLDNNLEIKIGDDCMFSSNIYMRTSDGHTIYDNSTGEVLNKSEKENIIIGNHVWGGSGISILKNTKISDNSIIARAAVVTKKFDSSNVVLAGSPAKIVKTNINWDRRTIEEYEKEVLCQKYQ